MTDRPDFDFEGVFDEDYLYFYEDLLTPERSDRDAELIVRLLGLSPRERVLDAPCGHGRIAIRLAGGGCIVTGLDASELFLNRARADAAAAGVEVDWVHGDLRGLTWRGEFDAIVNWFTSFGYFDDETNRAVLAGFHRALRPGGRLVIEHLNRDRIIRNLPEASMLPRTLLVHERGDDLMTDTVAFDAVAGSTRTVRTIVRGGRVRKAVFTVRVLTFPELREWLLGAGFTRVEAFGADGEPFSLHSARMVAVAHA
jgi:SAM-dependent methyltransferase